MTTRPITVIKPNAMPALAAASPSARSKAADPPLEFASKGTTTSNGTTARSCRRRTPKEALPYLVASWPLSRTSCRTKAEEDKAKPPPRTTNDVTGNEGAKKCARHAIISPVPKNWNEPIPKTSYFIDRTFSTDNSRPISNRKKIMPNSAKKCASCRPDIQFNPDGPRITPIAKKPRIDDVRRIFIMGTNSMVAPNKPRTSR
mmetsp:Transcript_35627/g.65276  ORF Transcript_35627/g.65276 Transcript_35627/m.65276 type:complete len:202 (-) Transcript_35627:572-1177(-)